jgi:hypothetical protein
MRAPLIPWRSVDYPAEFEETLVPGSLSSSRVVLRIPYSDVFGFPFVNRTQDRTADTRFTRAELKNPGRPFRSTETTFSDYSKRYFDPAFAEPNTT